MTVGQRIKEKRTVHGWSRTRLAKECGMPYSTLAALESGDMRSSTALPTIAAVLGVDPLWLSCGRGKSETGDSSTLLPVDERQLLTHFRKLSRADKEVLARVARGLAINTGEP